MAGKKGKRGSRKSRAEAFTGAKEAAVETRSAAPSFELPAPDDHEYHKKQVLGYLEQKESAHGRYRKAIDTAEKAGVDTKALLNAHKLKKENDPIKMRRHYEQMAFALKQEGYPIALTVHDTLEGEVNEVAYKRGFNDGENGRTAANPYPEQSDLSNQYAKGWEHGTAKNLGLTPEESDAALAEDGDEDEAASADAPWPDDQDVAAGEPEIPASLDRRRPAPVH
jgi:hypothetical protein